MIRVVLFYCCEETLDLMNIWITRKSSMKHYYLKKKIFTVTLIWKILVRQITGTQKEFVNTFKTLGEYHNLHVESDTLLLADEFENFPNICLKMLSSDPGLTWEAGFKKAEVKLDLLTDIIKGIRLKIYNFFLQIFSISNNKYTKCYNRNRECLFLKYWDENKLHGLAISQKISNK